MDNIITCTYLLVSSFSFKSIEIIIHFVFYQHENRTNDILLKSDAKRIRKTFFVLFTQDEPDEID